MTIIPAPPIEEIEHPPRGEQRTLTAPEVCEISGISYRQLDYWTTRHLLASDATHPGSGNARRFPLAEAEVATDVGELLTMGLALEPAFSLARRAHAGDLCARAALYSLRAYIDHHEGTTTP
jgi:DNA-binding transcriptional MerR regulator